MEKAFEIQKNARNNAKTLQTYITDLQNWETEMKRKEAAISGDFVKDLPPVRSKIKANREKLVPKKRLQKRISSSDYSAWEKFDVEKACENIDMEEVGPTSLDSKKSKKDKEEKFREEAQYEKERGNVFVKQEKWDEAISCYNRAIELDVNDAIYYANRGLCYLKKDLLDQAEKDCTEALKLDPTYVKALQRRATARERLGSLHAATNDLNEILKLEPHNTAAAHQLEKIKLRMGTKGDKSKSSSTSTPKESLQIRDTAKESYQPKITEFSSAPEKVKEMSPLEKWKSGEGEDINVLTTVKKPPHLRSKKALKPVKIKEVPLGQSYSVKTSTRMQIVETEDNLTQGNIAKDVNAKDNNNVQFMAEEKHLKAFSAANNNYLNEKACGNINIKEVGPTSSDSKKSNKDLEEKFREEAQYEKKRGNAFVKQEKWDEAISCYNRAIELDVNDAIYYANRGLCYLKKDLFQQAEIDCTEALKLDPTYVKALQRRAAARERLGYLRAATNDLKEVLKLEPHNTAAAHQLEKITLRMGTKGAKSKSSAASTPKESLQVIDPTKQSHRSKITELPSTSEKVKELSPLEKWKIGEGEDINVLTPVKKPPHLRSKRALKPIKIEEIPLGHTSPLKLPTRMQIVVNEDNLAQGDIKKELNAKGNKKEIGEHKVIGDGDTKIQKSDSMKLVAEKIANESNLRSHEMVPPVNSVQFMAEWKYLKGQDAARSNYLSIIEPSKIPSIFENALESDVLSEILRILHAEKEKFIKKTVTAYLKGLCRVKRFSALAMFLTASDKQLLNELLQYCKTVEKCKDKDVEELMKKYEL